MEGWKVNRGANEVWWIMQGPNVSGCKVLQITVYPVLSMWPMIINGEDDLEEWRPVINKSLTSNWFLTGERTPWRVQQHLIEELDWTLVSMTCVRCVGRGALHSVQMSACPMPSESSPVVGQNSFLFRP